MLFLGCLTIFNNLKFQSNVSLFNKDSVSEAETKECAVSTNFTRSLVCELFWPRLHHSERVCCQKRLVRTMALEISPGRSLKPILRF